jgi:hypothetical protein
MTVVTHPYEATKFIWELLFPVENHAAELAEPVTGGLRSGSAHHPSYARFPRRFVLTVTAGRACAYLGRFPVALHLASVAAAADCYLHETTTTREEVPSRPGGTRPACGSWLHLHACSEELVPQHASVSTAEIADV